jgi:hypothetical protein
MKTINTDHLTIEMTYSDAYRYIKSRTEFDDQVFEVAQALAQAMTIHVHSAKDVVQAERILLPAVKKHFEKAKIQIDQQRAQMEVNRCIVGLFLKQNPEYVHKR